MLHYTSGAMEVFLFQNSKKTLAVRNNLQVAQWEVYSRIHNPGGKKGKNAHGVGYPSTMKLELIDKSENASNILDFNLSPEELSLLLFKLERLRTANFEWSSDRLHAFNKGADGRCPMKRLSISRVPKDGSGKDFRSPWFIKVSNGTAIPEENTNGGMSAKRGSWKEEGKGVTVQLSDDKYYEFLNKTNRFIQLWEIAYGTTHIKQGDTLVEISRAWSSATDEAGAAAINKDTAKNFLISIAYHIVERDVQTTEVCAAYNELLHKLSTLTNTDFSPFSLKAKKVAKPAEASAQ